MHGRGTRDGAGISSIALCGPLAFSFCLYRCPSIHVSTCISLCLCLSFSLRVSLPVSLSARYSHLISVSRQGADPEAAPSPRLIVQAQEHQDSDNVTALPYLSYQSHLMIGIVTCVESVVEGDYACMNVLCLRSSFCTAHRSVNGHAVSAF